jgi:hypothetical protein
MASIIFLAMFLYKQACYRRTTTTLDSIHRPVFHSKHDIQETEFSIRLQMEPTELGPSGDKD